MSVDPTEEPTYPRYTYEQWPRDQRYPRGVAAGHTFGIHLMRLVRDEARRRIAAAGIELPEQVAEEVIVHTLFAMLDLLDGYQRAEIDPDHWAEYVLLMRVRSPAPRVPEPLNSSLQTPG